MSDAEILGVLFLVEFSGVAFSCPRCRASIGEADASGCLLCAAIDELKRRGGLAPAYSERAGSGY